jgi:nondiscriminating glutamyl-tRNA synthetase
VAERLRGEGAAYPCFCSRERLGEVKREQIAAGKTPHYDGHCSQLPAETARRRLDAGESAVLRLRAPAGAVRVDDLIRGRVEFGPDTVGDFIIIRSNGRAAYNFAAAVDDHEMAVSHVLRGDDHLANTARQLAVFAALAAPAPRYAHLSLVLGEDGGKLSKRHGATTVGEYRSLGYLPAAITNYLALLSWSHEEEVLSVDELIRTFDLKRLSASPAVFDAAKLDWLDHQHILRLTEREHRSRVAAHLPPDTPEPAIAAIAAAVRPSISRYDDVPEAAAPILEPPTLGEPEAEALRPAVRALTAFADLRAAGPRTSRTSTTRSTRRRGKRASTSR